MGIILGLLLVVLLVVAVSFALSRVVVRNHVKRAAAVLPPLGPRDFEQPAVGLTEPHRAYGLLRLTPAELLFANSTTREVLAVPRDRITGSTASRDIPTGGGMRTLRREALVVALSDPVLPSGLAFLVGSPSEWVARLRG